jgi:hypothetical protein
MHGQSREKIDHIIVVMLEVRMGAHADQGAVRITEGEVPGLGGRWRHGYGRRVSDVLVWANGSAQGPFAADAPRTSRAR